MHICNRSGVHDGMRFIDFDPDKALGSTLYRIGKFAELLFWSRTFNPDIIYVHQLNNWNWFRLSRALPKGSVTVYDAHTSVYLENASFTPEANGLPIVRSRENTVFREAQHIITVSKETKHFIESEFGLVPEKVTVVKNATTIKPLSCISTSVKKPVVCIAVLPQDGFHSNTLALHLLLQIALEMEMVDPNIIFKVTGGGTKPEPQSSNVVYTGYVDDFEGELKNADICLVPYPKEAVCGGVRNKVCDFMALGKVIVSSTEGMRGFDDCSENVEFLKAETAKEFVDAIIRLKDDDRLRKKLAENALKKSYRYQWPNRADEVLSTFEKLLSI